jgi:hypothetical protein
MKVGKLGLHIKKNIPASLLSRASRGTRQRRKRGLKAALLDRPTLSRI